MDPEKAERRAKRERRSAAFKRNVQRYGLAKAKLIAVCITRKQKGVWRETSKSIERFKRYKRLLPWVADPEWAGHESNENSYISNY